jgi:outer membrane immunogenic protein
MRKKGFLIATSAGFAAAATMPGAQAADMPIKAPRYVEPAASWAGWYIGAHAGAAWQKADVNSNATIFDGYSFLPILGASISKTGFIGGGQIGYNWQHGNFVFGIEADGSGLSGRASATVAVGQGYKATHASRIGWLSTVRGRFGLAVGDTLAYATAGVAFGGVRNSARFDLIESFSFSSSRTKTGWTVGGGVEHMLNRNWTIGLEGLFVDLGRSTIDTDFGSLQFNNQAIIGRLKVNYKF